MAGVQRIQSLEDIERIQFEDGMAAVEVAPGLLDHMRFKNDRREPSPRYSRVLNSIRDRGYDPTQPIIARIGQKGRWIIVDGGHRLTAARQVHHEFWSNLFHAKVGNLYFLLFTTPRSFRKVAADYGIDPKDIRESALQDDIADLAGETAQDAPPQTPGPSASALAAAR